MEKTAIIAIEGIDGSGKGVQFARLRDALIARGYTVATRDYPVYTSFFGHEVGEYLAGSNGVPANTVDSKSMALWYALDRFEDLRDYRDGETDILLINRYVLSNAVYQSIRDIDLDKHDVVDWVLELEYGHFHLPRPRINLFFDVLAKDAAENVLKKGFRDYVGTGRDVYEASSSMQERARLKYLECSRRFDDVSVIDCTRDGKLLPIEEITALALERLMALGIIAR